jgi:hypothetical protein
MPADRLSVQPRTLIKYVDLSTSCSDFHGKRLRRSRLRTPAEKCNAGKHKGGIWQAGSDAASGRWTPWTRPPIPRSLSPTARHNAEPPSVKDSAKAWNTYLRAAAPCAARSSMRLANLRSRRRQWPPVGGPSYGEYASHSILDIFRPCVDSGGQGAVAGMSQNEQYTIARCPSCNLQLKFRPSRPPRECSRRKKSCYETLIGPQLVAVGARDRAVFSTPVDARISSTSNTSSRDFNHGPLDR